MAFSVAVVRLPHFEGLDLPSYETAGSAGMDLRAAVEDEVILGPGTWALVPTGLQIALPEGSEAQIRPRSGLAFKHGVTVLNAPGTIDSDYRGEVKVLLVNHGTQPFSVTRGMRIAQMVVAPVVQATWEDGDTLPETDRSAGGFGSTGVA